MRHPQTIVTENRLASGLLGSPANMPDDAQARAEIPVSEVDRLFGEYKLLRILGHWPFKVPAEEPEIPAPTTVPEQIALQMYRQRTSWPQAMARLRQHYEEHAHD